MLYATFEQMVQNFNLTSFKKAYLSMSIFQRHVTMFDRETVECIWCACYLFGFL